MIIYDMPYRGAFNYDKFALNILQLSNYVNFMSQKIELEITADNNILALQSQTQNLADLISSLSNQLFIQSLNIKE